MAESAHTMVVRVMEYLDTSQAERKAKAATATASSMAKKIAGWGAMGAASAVVGIVGAAAAFSALAGAIALTAQHAGKVELVRAAFASFSGEAGQGLDRLVASFQEAAAGLLTQLDIMKLYVPAAIKGVTDDFFKTTLEFASRMAPILGKNVLNVVNMILGAVENLEGRGLGTLGLTNRLREAVNRWAATHGKAAKSLSESEKRLAAQAILMRDMHRILNVLPQDVGAFAFMLRRLVVIAKDFFDRMSLALTRSEAMRQAVKLVTEWIRDWTNSVVDATSSQEGLAKSVQIVNGALEGFLSILHSLLGVVDALLPAVNVIIKGLLRIASIAEGLARIFAPVPFIPKPEEMDVAVRRYRQVASVIERLSKRIDQSEKVLLLPQDDKLKALQNQYNATLQDLYALDEILVDIMQEKPTYATMEAWKRFGSILTDLRQAASAPETFFGGKDSVLKYEIEILKKYGEALEQFIEQIYTVGEKPPMTAWGKVVWAFKQAWKDMGAPVSAVDAAMKLLINTVGNAKTRVGELIGVIRHYGDDVAPMAEEKTVGLGRALLGMADAAEAAVTRMGNISISISNKITSAILAGAAQGYDIWMNAAAQFGEALYQNIRQSLLKLFTEAVLQKFVLAPVEKALSQLEFVQVPVGAGYIRGVEQLRGAINETMARLRAITPVAAYFQDILAETLNVVATQFGFTQEQYDRLYNELWMLDQVEAKPTVSLNDYATPQIQRIRSELDGLARGVTIPVYTITYGIGGGARAMLPQLPQHEPAPGGGGVVYQKGPTRVEEPEMSSAGVNINVFAVDAESVRKFVHSDAFVRAFDHAVTAGKLRALRKRSLFSK